MPKHNWPELIQAHAQSGQSVPAFCEKHRLTRSVFYAQRAKQAGKFASKHSALLPIGVEANELRITVQLRTSVSIRGSAADLAQVLRCL
jgi:hypothetical protein